MKIQIKVESGPQGKFIYRGTDAETGEELFANTMDAASGICEFVGAVHGLMYIKKNQLYGDVFVKNPYIKDCIENKKFRHEAKEERDKELLRRAKLFLLESKSNINIELY